MWYLTNILKLKDMIHKAAVSLSDEDAIEAVELFPVWQPDTDYTVDGKRYRWEDKLYRIRQAHRSQAQYPPGVDTAALYELVSAPGQGDTPDDPIPYSSGMALVRDKYYEQYGVVYVCIRGSGIPVYADLSALVHNYVEVVE